ncbi:MAG: MBL fold metallo-hydrolase [Phycisphaerae bacterium]|nr:MBL fold metallo-hydrolase [Phycisphaerae bacterium]MDD5381994.1 MBL fold metallo-hydrolase [Phycisphaerae bacterium]
MEIDRLILGEYQTNCYVLRENKTAKDCLIIDTGLDADELVDFLRQHNLNPIAAVLTHGHADHITGLAALRSRFPNIKVYIHKLDAGMLTGEKDSLYSIAGVSFSPEHADFTVEDGDVIKQTNIKLDVLHTPGHTQGGICLYSKDDGIIFAGDTLFADSVGRTDFPGGNAAQLIKSIKQKLCSLPDETIVYPGHGPQTTISQEKTHNPFLQ